MPIDFFQVPCTNQIGNCQTEVIQCLQPITDIRFGISDANSDNRTPAIVMRTNDSEWDLTIENPNRKEVRYKAIDYCVEIFRTGTYDVNNDLSDIRDFSSDYVPFTPGRQLIKRCEGMLVEENMGILFFEIKVSTKGKWLADARRKFEETILSFIEHHPDQTDRIIEPIVSNKAFESFRVHQSEMVQKKILKDKIGKELKISTIVTID